MKFETLLIILLLFPAALSQRHLKGSKKEDSKKEGKKGKKHKAPSNTPSANPSKTPSNTPSANPSKAPSNTPSAILSEAPSNTPSTSPSEASIVFGLTFGFNKSLPPIADADRIILYQLTQNYLVEVAQSNDPENLFESPTSLTIFDNQSNPSFQDDGFKIVMLYEAIFPALPGDVTLNNVQGIMSRDLGNNLANFIAAKNPGSPFASASSIEIVYGQQTAFEYTFGYQGIDPLQVTAGNVDGLVDFTEDFLNVSVNNNFIVNSPCLDGLKMREKSVNPLLRDLHVSYETVFYTLNEDGCRYQEFCA